MSFSIMSWNVRKFRGTNQVRINDVVTMVRDLDPDIFGIIEFEAKAVARDLIANEFTDYDFGLTDSKRAIELLVGWRRGVFDQVLFTQRREFQAGKLDLRPGALLSVSEAGDQAFHNILLLHTDSGREKGDYDRRQAMFGKLWSLRNALRGLPIQQGEPRLIVLGDLNTMGRKRVGNSPSIGEAEEIDALRRAARRRQMTMLSKAASLTYRSPGGTLDGNLDHVIASDDLTMQVWESNDTELSSFSVDVTGWNQLNEPQRTRWIENVSDHCALYCEIVS